MGPGLTARTLASVPPSTIFSSSSVRPRASIARISSAGLVIGQSEPKTIRSAPCLRMRLRTPGGAAKTDVTDRDHPMIAALPPQNQD